MARKLAVTAAMAVCSVLAQPRPASPPMFSPAYVDALKNILDLEPADAAALAARVRENPEDFAARLKLMAYAMRADRVALESSRRQRIELTLWLIEHHPDSEILKSPYAQFNAQELNGDLLDRAERLWRSALDRLGKDPKVEWNAALFYAGRDRRKYFTCAESAVALDPGNKRYGRALGIAYAEAIIGLPALGPAALERLEKTGNAYVLEGAVNVLQSEHNKSLMFGREEHRLGDLATHYFARARALDPNLDPAYVYPRLDPKMEGALAPGAPQPAKPALKPFRSLKPDAFADLPKAIRDVLRARGCSIPQPLPEGPRGNVIRGEFFEKGKIAWAVLCGSGGLSSILVFRGGEDTHPGELAKSADETYAGDGSYAREIAPVGRKFILDHYRAYGGPEPPPLDHQGIDDAFVEKASVTYYWYQGKWRKLTGSD